MIEQTRIIMGMPIILKVPSHALTDEQVEQVFGVFEEIDRRYSPYRNDSEVSQLQGIPLFKRHYSPELATIMRLAEETKRDTQGYFDVEHKGVFDPSGIVKGWAIQKAARVISTWTPDFYIEAGGDLQVGGVSEQQTPWQIGVRNPFDRSQNIAVTTLDDKAIATSGTAVRGDHIYDPVENKELNAIVSVTVISSDIIDADRMATAAFAMGEKGIYFLEKLPGYEALMVDANGISTETTGWKNYQVAA